MVTKFELRLQLDSASTAAINLAISQSMQQVATAISQTCDRLRRSMHDLAFFQREALEKSGQLHTLLVRKYMDEVDRASRTPPVQPSHPAPASLLRQSSKSPPPLAPTVAKPNSRTRNAPPARAVAPRQHIPKTHLTPLPPTKALPATHPQSPAQTEEFHLHHFLVVIKQTCSLR